MYPESLVKIDFSMFFEAILDDGGQIFLLHLLQLIFRKVIVFCLEFCAPVKGTVAALFFFLKYLAVNVLQRWLSEGCFLFHQSITYGIISTVINCLFSTSIFKAILDGLHVSHVCHFRQGCWLNTSKI
jgi:hypothetical protein